MHALLKLSYDLISRIPPCPYVGQQQLELSVSKSNLRSLPLYLW
jgi:hypothetical protein